MKLTLVTHISPISLLGKEFHDGNKRHKNTGCCFRFSNNLTGIVDNREYIQ